MIRLMVTISLCVLVANTADAQRTHRLVNRGWRFHKVDVAGASEVAFDDSTWELGSLPDTWNAQDGQDGGSDFWRGIGRYRKTLPYEEEWSGKRFFPHFESALTTTEVFENGVSAGVHKGGYAVSRFDITDLIKAGENTLAVSVDNSLDEGVPPLSGVVPTAIIQKCRDALAWVGWPRVRIRKDLNPFRRAEAY